MCPKNKSDQGAMDPTPKRNLIRERHITLHLLSFLSLNMSLKHQMLYGGLLWEYSNIPEVWANLHLSHFFKLIITKFLENKMWQFLSEVKNAH